MNSSTKRPTKLFSLGETPARITRMKNRTDLTFGEVVQTAIIYQTLETTKNMALATLAPPPPPPQKK